MRLPDSTLPGALALAILLISFQNSEAVSEVNKQIIGGVNALKGYFPWMVRLSMPKGNGKASLCGGSIIASKWILTASHCHHGYLPTVAYVGGVKNKGDDAEIIIKNFKHFIKHDNYLPVDIPFISRNDIALIELTSRLSWTDNMKPVKLPRRSQPPLGAGTKVYVAGYGRNTENGGGVPGSLLYVNFMLRNDAYCARLLLLCTTFQIDRGIHKGDSGGPWVWKDPSGVDRLVGVSNSHNGSFADGGITSRAADVHSHLEWISRKTGIYIED